MKKIFLPWEKDEFLSELEEKKQAIRHVMGQVRVVTTNGCFDILHYGHLLTLYEANQLGNILVVGLNSDKSVKLNKEEKRPILSEEERALGLVYCSLVDFIYIYDEKTSEEFIRLVKPDIHVKGKGYTEDLIEKDVVEDVGGKIYLVESDYDISDTEIIRRIREKYTC
jgi:glycerol-3-phosphate cytidylyltransferase